MKAVVKSIPVRYNGKTYQPGETVDVKQEYFDEGLFNKVEEKKKSKEGE